MITNFTQFSPGTQRRQSKATTDVTHVTNTSYDYN